jgi:hypothetical protein
MAAGAGEEKAGEIFARLPPGAPDKWRVPRSFAYVANEWVSAQSGDRGIEITDSD